MVNTLCLIIIPSCYKYKDIFTEKYLDIYIFPYFCRKKRVFCKL